MNKKLCFLLGIAASGLGLSAFADTQPVLDLPAYYAQPAPKPPLNQRVSQSFDGWIHGIYLHPSLGYAFASVSDIEDTTVNTDPNIIPPTLSNDSTKDNIAQFGIALGYQFRNSGLLNRVELAYTYRSNFDYNEPTFYNFNDPFNVNNTSLNSTIKNQTLLLKGYYDINFGSPFIPYLQAGLGVSRNSVSGSSTATNPFLSPNTVSFNNTETNFAWDAGLGLRLKMNEHVSLQAGYEFDWLGKLNWTAATFNSSGPSSNPISSDRFFANVLDLGIILKN